MNNWDLYFSLESRLIERNVQTDRPKRIQHEELVVGKKTVKNENVDSI